MAVQRTLALFCLLLIAVESVLALKQPEVEEEVKHLRTLIAASGDAEGNLRLIPGAVRLSFHDCIGGCDGCINLNNEENNGLGPNIELLNKLYADRTVSRVMSRADYWALAGITATQMASEYVCAEGETPPCSGARPKLTFRYGRVDCPTSPSSSEMLEFPDDLAGFNKTMEFFSKEFGFNSSQTTALLGAHTLGRTTMNNSGFEGPWVDNENALDNDYYIDMSNSSLNWTQRQPSTDLFQWNQKADNTSDEMMLNSDICLVIDVTVNVTGFSSCGYHDCPKSPTADLVKTYAQDNSRWMADYSDVFQKVIEHTNASLMLPDPAPSAAWAATGSYLTLILLLFSVLLLVLL